MTLEELTQRLMRLEAEVAILKAGPKAENAAVWFEQFSGSMANDPGFEEMLRSGKEWRNS